MVYLILSTRPLERSNGIEYCTYIVTSKGRPDTSYDWLKLVKESLQFKIQRHLRVLFQVDM